MFEHSGVSTLLSVTNPELLAQEARTQPDPEAWLHQRLGVYLLANYPENNPFVFDEEEAAAGHENCRQAILRVKQAVALLGVGAE